MKPLYKIVLLAFVVTSVTAISAIAATCSTAQVFKGSQNGGDFELQ